MARTLDVYFESRLVGRLVQDDGGQMLFRYATGWLDDPERFPVSRSLPLKDAEFKQKECRGFFGGLLPEQSNRTVIARILQISDRNDFAMLERIGGECAGALTFVPEGSPPPHIDHTYRPLSDDELQEILETLPKRPLLAGEKGVRLSLAGAQDKIAVRVNTTGRISLPLSYAPSTHVLKPAIATWEGLVSNETFCHTLAQAVGLPVATASAHNVGDIEYLLSERYDRAIDEDGTIRRLHQEDFCQALGVPSEIKYQAEGGPGLKDCFALLRAASNNVVKDVGNLLDAVIFNLLVGNNDAHAKNFSLLYNRNGKARLAPLYDLVSTVYYPEIENRLAMKIGAQAIPDLVFPDDVEVFAREVGIAVAATKRRVLDLAELTREKAREIEPSDAAAEALSRLVISRCERMLSRFK